MKGTTQTPWRHLIDGRKFLPKPKQLVRHFKGDLYRIVRVITDEYGTWVIYENWAGEEFTKNRDEFWHEVQFQAPVDIWVPRFTLLAERVDGQAFRMLKP